MLLSIGSVESGPGHVHGVLDRSVLALSGLVPHLLLLSVDMLRWLPLAQVLLSRPSAPAGFLGLEVLAPTTWFLGSEFSGWWALLVMLGPLR